MRRSGRPRLDLGLGRQHRLALRELVELDGIDRNRPRPQPRAVAVDRDLVDGPVRLHAEDVHARALEALAPARRVEADDVVGEQALVDRAPDRLRKDAPVVGHRPRDVHEVRHQRVRSPLAHEPRRDVEVVVVEEDGRVRLALELGDDGVGERLVDGDVAVVPCVVEAVVDVGCGREPPEVVLDEPQHRVRDHVVVPVVGGRVVRDQVEPVRRPAVRHLVHRPVCLFRHDAVLLRHRARDPGDVVVVDEAAEGRDEAAATAPGDAPASGVAVVHDRPAVRDDDQLAPGRHGDTLDAGLRRCAARRPARPPRRPCRRAR